MTSLRFSSSVSDCSMLRPFRSNWLAGYYQKAFVHVRDILETYFLVDYLRSNPAKVAIWKKADKRQRAREFSPMRNRDELDKRSGYIEGARKAAYDLISENASH